MSKPKPITFNPSEEDAEILARIKAHNGVGTPAALRMSLRSLARELGVWTPPAFDSAPGDEPAAEDTDEPATAAAG